MSRIDAALYLLETPEGRSLLPGDPASDAILELLVRMASSDGHLDARELEMLQGMLPDLGDFDLRAFVDRVNRTALDLAGVAAALPDDDHRWTALRFCARMAAKDEVIDDEEDRFLAALAAALDLPDGALDRVRREIGGLPTDDLTPERLAALVEQLQWDAVDLAPGAVESPDLVPRVPDGAVGVYRVGVDAAEVIGLYVEGLVGRFLEGCAFLPWRSLVGHSRSAGLAAGLCLHTEDGRAWTLVDRRLAGLGLLLDRLHGPEAPRASLAAPTILKIDPGSEEEPGHTTWDDVGQSTFDLGAEATDELPEE